MARSTESAELMLTSCSADRPPAKMPTRSRVMRASPPALGQSPTNSISYSSSTPKRACTSARTRSPSARTSAAAAPRLGDDEVGVPLADRGAADPQPLEAGGVDQPAGVVAGRVAEDAARVLVGERLGRDPLRLVGRHAGGDRGRLVGAQA